MARRAFPFPPLPPGQVTPQAGPGEIWENVPRDTKIIRWFIEEWYQRPPNPDSPLVRLLDAYEAVDWRQPAQALESVELESRRHLLYAVGSVEFIAWAVRALHGRPDACEGVDANFLHNEMLGEDSKEKNHELRKLPGGFGTLVLAGRLLQAGGGHVRIYGDKSAGCDMRWVTAQGDVVLIERKDRSYDAGLHDAAEKRARRVREEVKRSHIPMEEGAVRLLSVGFMHLVGPSCARRIDGKYQHALEGFRGNPDPGLPDLVLVEHLGLEPKTGGAKEVFFSPQAIRWPEKGSAVYRVMTLVARAVGYLS